MLRKEIIQIRNINVTGNAEEKDIEEKRKIALQDEVNVYAIMLYWY